MNPIEYAPLEACLQDVALLHSGAYVFISILLQMFSYCYCHLIHHQATAVADLA